MSNICEECELREPVKICTDCEQWLCEECDSQIHNKGKRARH